MGRLALLALTLAALAGCERKPSGPAAPSTAAASTPATSDKVSIIRPEVEVGPEPAKPIAPLHVLVGFDEGGSSLSAAAMEALEGALASEQMKAGGAITLGGHSDSAGEDAANLSESRKRAEAVRGWLVKHGVAKDRIALVAFGDQNPIAPNALPNGEPDAAGRARNRRVELTIAAPGGAGPASEPSEDGTLVDELSGAE